MILVVFIMFSYFTIMYQQFLVAFQCLLVLYPELPWMIESFYCVGSTLDFVLSASLNITQTWYITSNEHISKPILGPLSIDCRQVVAWTSHFQKKNHDGVHCLDPSSIFNPVNPIKQETNSKHWRSSAFLWFFLVFILWFFPWFFLWFPMVFPMISSAFLWFPHGSTLSLPWCHAT